MMRRIARRRASLAKENGRCAWRDARPAVDILRGDDMQAQA
jgi:hypothetical protein